LNFEEAAKIPNFTKKHYMLWKSINLEIRYGDFQIEDLAKEGFKVQKIMCYELDGSFLASGSCTRLALLQLPWLEGFFKEGLVSDIMETIDELPVVQFLQDASALSKEARKQT
jgi:hypothetical protein